MADFPIGPSRSDAARLPVQRKPTRSIDENQAELFAQDGAVPATSGGGDDEQKAVIPSVLHSKQAEYISPILKNPIAALINSGPASCTANLTAYPMASVTP
jgi:hypothetical protein